MFNYYDEMQKQIISNLNEIDIHVITEPHAIADSIVAEIYNEMVDNEISALGCYTTTVAECKKRVTDNIELLKKGIDLMLLETDDILTDFLEERWENLDAVIREYVFDSIAADTITVYVMAARHTAESL